MKKLLTSLAVVAIVAATSFFQTNTVDNSKLLAVDPPIITFPPRITNELTTTPVMNVMEVVAMNTTRTI